MRLRWLSRYYPRPVQSDVIDSRDGLLVRTERKASLMEALLSCAVMGAFVAIACIRFLRIWEVIVLAIVSASLAFLIAKRTERFELRITRKEFVARGRVGDNLGGVRSVCTADILWLEYQEDTTGADSARHPGGLYAVVRHRSICILPDIDQKQTALIIERVKNRFPDLREQWAANSPFGSHFITLGLNESNRSRG